jgi:dipeptidyl aminopeptidase/acylaminoacyl peptidase
LSSWSIRTLWSTLALLGLLLAGPCPAGQAAGDTAEPHPFSVHDMLTMARISEPQVSPDGEWVVFTVRETDLEANRGRTDLWLARLKDGRLRRLTTDPANDFGPRWHPFGRIYFLSTRSGSAQVWSIDPGGGEACQVTDLPLDVSNLEVAPQLESLLFTMDVYPGATIGQTVERDQEKEACPATGMVYDELLFRHWDTWEDGKRSHVFIRPIADDAGRARDLMVGLDADVPSHPWGGTEEFTVSPDGSSLIFTAKMAPGSEAAWTTDFDLYAVPTGRSEPMRCLTEENEAWDTEPVFSPDGHTMAYLAMARPGYEADRFRIVLLDMDNGERRVLTEAWDRSPGQLVWSADGKTIYCSAPNLGQRSLYAVEARSGRVREIVKMGRNTGLQPAGKRLLFARQDLRSPTELWTVRTDGKDARQLTDFNGPRLAGTLMGEPEQFTFAGWNGEQVWAYVVKPYDWSPEAAASGRKWPVTFLIHGGPQGSFGNDFHYRWNPQAYVGAGFATLAVDFHGSTGYGQEFTDAINQHWGDRPYEDLVKGLDAALARYPWMDGDRVVAAGASYGGYMINWIAGQPFADRFRAFVCHDGNIDELMAYFDTEELWFPEWENGGTPWDGPEGAFRTFSPIRNIAKWHVPTLVVHGGKDYRVVDSQGLSAFTALRRLGVPARLLYFPDENHWVLKPRNSIQWHDEVMAWLRRWTE